jgi:hypothetical protein
MSTLRRVFVLIDARHGPKQTDIDMMLNLNSLYLPYQLIITKSDVASTYDLYKALYMCFDIMKSHKGTSTCIPYIFTTSSKSQKGVPVLKDGIAEILSHVWKIRQKPVGFTGTDASANVNANAGVGGVGANTAGTAGVLGQGPDDMASMVSNMNQMSGSNADSTGDGFMQQFEYDDFPIDVGGTSNGPSTATTPTTEMSMSSMNAEEFEIALKAEGNEDLTPEMIGKLMTAFKANISDIGSAGAIADINKVNGGKKKR